MRPPSPVPPDVLFRNTVCLPRDSCDRLFGVDTDPDLDVFA